jgi:UMF1 family MFS transporter
LFLVAYFLFADAITTVIYYAALFGETVYGFAVTDVLIFFAVTQLTAIPGAFIFGYIADRIGTKKTLISTLFIWIFALLLAYLGTEQIVWWIVGMIAGVGMGSSQSTARSMYGQFIPDEKKASSPRYLGPSSTELCSYGQLVPVMTQSVQTSWLCSVS